MKPLQIDQTLWMNDGHAIPQLGFGVFQLTESATCQQAVHAALAAGIRHFDTATVYRNEDALGQALRDSGLPREELFVTTKCWISDFGPQATRRAFTDSLKALKMDYVDLYLLHWPQDADMMSAWEVLQELRLEGRARSIGVSNFSVARFDFFFRHTEEVPAVNQIELHPWRAQKEVQQFHQHQNIVTVAYSPLGRAQRLEEPVLKQLARECGRSPAQLLLRWHLQQGRVVIPKSQHPDRIRENAAVYDFQLTADQMAVLDALNTESSVISWRPGGEGEWY